MSDPLTAAGLAKVRLMTHSQIIELMARAIIQAYSPRSHPDAWKAWKQHAIAAYDALTAAGLAKVRLMTHSQIIELMARAIIQAYSPRSHPDAWKAWEQHAIAAYDALTAAGLAILPIEPSADDIDVIAYALAKACADFYGDRFPETFDMTLSRCLAKAAHDAMIAAAMKERGE